MRVRFLVMSAVLAAGCNSDDGGSGTVMRYEDTGSICVCPPGQSLCSAGVQRFEPDQPARLSFSVDGVCLSSSCSRDRETSCTVTRDGSTLTVSTSASFTDVTPSGGACTDDCGLLSATCETEPLPSGSYTIVYGGHSMSITVPSETHVDCLRN